MGRFETKIEGYYGFFRYDMKEVEAIAPPEANAFTLGKIGIMPDSNHGVHFAHVEFFKADIDLTKRLYTCAEIEADDALLVRLSS